MLNTDLARIVQACLNSTYFLSDGKYYELKVAAATDSPLSPVAVSLYRPMPHIKKVASEMAELKPIVWPRYVDGTPRVANTLVVFLEHLNSMPNIRFTMEMETNGSLSLLDVRTTT